MRSRWSARLCAPLLAMAVVAGLAASSPSPTDAGPAATGADCPPVVPPEAAPAPRPAVAVSVVPLLTAAGEYVGRQVSFQPRRGTPVTTRLAADSFVAGPFGDRLLYGQHHPGGGSEVGALSLDTGCSVPLAQTQDVVRGALLDASGETLFVHTVSEDDRSDGGITRIDIATGASSEALPPFEPDEAFGLIFATGLSWNRAADALAVQSCGYERCVTRLLELADGSIATYEAEHGMLVGMTASHLVAFAAEHVRPAELLAIELTSGAARVLADEVLTAELTDDPAGTVLIETPAGRQEVQP